MSGLIALVYDNATHQADLAFDAQGLLDDDAGFESAVTVSLFTWQRDETAELNKVGTKYGWWGDTLSDVPDDRIGSRFYTFRRRKNSPAARQDFLHATEDALAWMVTDGIAKSITVEVERLQQAQEVNAVALKVIILRADGKRWEKIWEIHFNGL